MRVFLINSGSSSIKYQIVDVFEGESSQDLKVGPVLLISSVKGIDGTATLELVAEGKVPKTITQPVLHHVAIQWIFELLGQCKYEREHSLSLSGQ